MIRTPGGLYLLAANAIDPAHAEELRVYARAWRDQQDLLGDALIKAVDQAEAAHATSVRAANVHNNLDGVGQKFDYMDPSPLAAWVPEARRALEKAGLR